jgi:hypothetical protein
MTAFKKSKQLNAALHVDDGFCLKSSRQAAPFADSWAFLAIGEIIILRESLRHIVTMRMETYQDREGGDLGRRYSSISAASEMVYKFAPWALNSRCAESGG